MSSICLQLLSKTLSIAFAFACLLNIWQSGYSVWPRSYRYFLVVRPKAWTLPGLCRVRPGWRTRAFNQVSVHSSKHTFPVRHDPHLGQESARSQMSTDRFILAFSAQRGKRGTCRGWPISPLHAPLLGSNERYCKCCQRSPKRTKTSNQTPNY